MGAGGQSGGRAGRHLGVDDGCHPECLTRSGDGQRGPEEHQNRKDQRQTAGRHHVVQHDDQVTHRLRPDRTT